ERGDLDHLGERAHALTLDGPVEHPEEPRGPLAARGALAARLAHVEGEQRPHDVLNRHALVEGDDAARSRIDRTARDERLVELPRGNDTPGRLAPEPRLDGEGRARAGHRAIAFDRLEERGFLAQDEAAGAATQLDIEREVGSEDALAEEPPLARLRHGDAEALGRKVGLPVD